MAGPRQVFSWWAFADKGIDADGLLRGAKAIGYSGVELMPPELWDAARDHGLSIVSHQGHQSIESGLNDLAQHDRIEREILNSLEQACRYHIPYLIVFSGNRRPGESDAQGLEHTVRGLQRVARAAETAGVTLILELLNSRVDHPGYQCDHTAWGIQVCQQVNSPRVRLLYDIYHMQVMEGDIIATIQQNHSYFAHYHTAGVPGRHDLDSEQELNYPAILRAIAATGYDGYLGHEFLPKANPLAALQAAYHLCGEN